MNITVLGAGMVGSAIAKDLAKEPEYQVTVADISQHALEKIEAEVPITACRTDLRDAGAISPLIADSELVICAIPGFMGFRTLQQIIEAGKDVVDISFFSEDPFLLDDLAKKKNVTAVVDCGVAPGLCNILAGYRYDRMDEVHSYSCYVGGLPQTRQWPFEYKAVFSPRDVLEEYIRPARFVEHGRVVVKPALSDIELVSFPDIGTLEAFNTDGLRTLIKTLDIPEMREKTLRYPGHANLMKIFRESGFFNTEAIDVDGQQVKPISVTSRLLFDQWRLQEQEADITTMQVILTGIADKKPVTYTCSLLDRYDEETSTTSMARTTGYTCSIVARQVLTGMFSQKGICPPEFVGRTKWCYEHLLAEYEKRDIKLKETITEG